MNSEELKEAFKNDHPELMKLNPDVEVYEIEEYGGSETNGEVIKYNPPLKKIEVSHPFIFDNRLVPKEFENIEVINITYVNSFPMEFDVSNDEEILIAEFYHPKRYMKFVERELKSISKKLLIKDLTKEEALDALTGDFKKLLEDFNADNYLNK